MREVIQEADPVDLAKYLLQADKIKQQRMRNGTSIGQPKLMKRIEHPAKADSQLKR